MGKQDYFSLADVARQMGISRIAVYKKVKAGKIPAVKIGRSFAVPGSFIEKNSARIMGQPLGAKEKRGIEAAVKRTVKEYGEVLKRLGSE